LTLIEIDCTHVYTNPQICVYLCRGVIRTVCLLLEAVQLEYKNVKQESQRLKGRVLRIVFFVVNGCN